MAILKISLIILPKKGTHVQSLGLFALDSVVIEIMWEIVDHFTISQQLHLTAFKQVLGVKYRVSFCYTYNIFFWQIKMIVCFNRFLSE